ncbi:hypothetical protein HS088_TW02G00319 [Tripterygium wilfordii]|uniref:NT domain of poly(A) polymerase and terminal uridylyl transferase-containing protein n=1 Tax=Tripterygium wilfordii TaxID=458696 RepID=A0A7J7DYZ5_TRIWF|nr:uncharacterized protein LOC119982728 [Tripterygium wilfordii]KAF5751306.1 hypothetical protein HS088_TW02G00319 [Tripterygium wilfordii]
MGYSQFCSFARENVCVSGHGLLCSASAASVSNPDTAAVAADCWKRAERTAREILAKIQPNVEADQKRMDVIHYVQGLINYYLGCEVFAYGSVPLKTYLPDGDIDLTAINGLAVEESLVSNVHAVLKWEEQNRACPYEVRDVHCIDAEVKLVKCLVENIVVDVSFNQLGGLRTLCFLEEVDCLIGKDHLFKRSIILIKAWCYYESRILGAHHGLISTYALETMVLYIFHLFHSSLNGPLAVLYKFLDYFCKFDWENYCISLNGPVHKSSLPDIVVASLENGGDDALISKEFLERCANVFSFPSQVIEANSRTFSQKYLNIIDPLKENNNLGRSVNQANFCRIRSAFGRGACKLGEILLLSSERIADELSTFFANTLDRHGSSDCSDHQASALHFRPGDSDRKSSSSCSDMGSDDKYLKPLIADYNTNALSQYFLARDVNELSGQSRQSPHLSFPSLFKEQGIMGNTTHFREINVNSLVEDEDITPLSSGLSISATTVTENLSPSARDMDLAVLDLCGDYHNLIQSVPYGPHCHSCFVSATPLPSPPLSPLLPNENSWGTVHQSPQFNKNGHSQFYPGNTSFGSDGKNKSRGIGTYFPKAILNRWNRDKPSSGKGRKVALGNNTQLNRRPRNDDSTVVTQETNMSGERGHELSLEEYPLLGGGKAGSSENLPSHLSGVSVWGCSHANGFSNNSEKSKSVSDIKELKMQGFPMVEEINPLESVMSCIEQCASSFAESSIESPKPVLLNNTERLEEQSYHLRDEVDFPPLGR